MITKSIEKVLHVWRYYWDCQQGKGVALMCKSEAIRTIHI